MRRVAAKDVRVGDTLVHSCPGRVEQVRVEAVEAMGRWTVLRTTGFDTVKHPRESVTIIPGSATCACGRPVEQQRLVYATPICSVCLPFPEPLH